MIRGPCEKVFVTNCNNFKNIKQEEKYYGLQKIREERDKEN